MLFVFQDHKYSAFKNIVSFFLKICRTYIFPIIKQIFNIKQHNLSSHTKRIPIMFFQLKGDLYM